VTGDEEPQRYERADEFIRHLREVAPELSEEQLENIRRASAGDPPPRQRK
jgi:hypothetical protein